MQYPDARLLVFCKAPVAGEVKTRLTGYFDKRGMNGKKIAARLHQFLALHCLERITKTNIAPVQLWCSPDKTHPFFKHCEDKFNVELKEQGQGDLGERMSRSFDDALSAGSCAVVIGTDCPMLDSSIIEQVFARLSKDSCSVIGPAEDGGYVLLGLSKNQPEIFKDIPWGSSRVHIETIKKLRGDIQELSTMWDIDRPEDVGRLINEANALELSDDFKSFLKTIA